MGRHPHLAGLAFESRQDVDLAREALERCGAAQLASRSIHELSSGERQRIVFARALTQQPRSLLLDEPASFLDIRHQVALYDIVRQQVAERGCSVLTVLHDLNLAAEYCDRIYLLRDGRIEARRVDERGLHLRQPDTGLRHRGLRRHQCADRQAAGRPAARSGAAGARSRVRC